jgi:hypothetical protein
MALSIFSKMGAFNCRAASLERLYPAVRPVTGQRRSAVMNTWSIFTKHNLVTG